MIAHLGTIFWPNSCLPSQEQHETTRLAISTQIIRVSLAAAGIFNLLFLGHFYPIYGLIFTLTGWPSIAIISPPAALLAVSMMTTVSTALTIGMAFSAYKVQALTKVIFMSFSALAFGYLTVKIVSLYLEVALKEFGEEVTNIVPGLAKAFCRTWNYLE